MKIHAVQTGAVQVKRKQMKGEGHGFLRRLRTLADRTWSEPLPIFAWVVEHPEGLLVVDTGETSRTAEPGYFPSWHPYFRLGVREDVSADQEIGPRMRALNLPPEEVRWVVLTHLHTDHAGGLHHFPNAEILVTRTEMRTASGRAGQLRGYLPNRWPAWFKPRFVDFKEEPFGVFSRSLTLTRSGDVVLLPTPGHSAGHLSVVVEEDNKRLFFAGDVSYTQQLMMDQAIDGVSPDEKVAAETLRQVSRFSEEKDVVYLPSHDPGAERRLQDRTILARQPRLQN